MKIRVLAGLLAAVGISSTAMAQEADQITYNSHVGRIINENCVVCHREDGIGPMQFETYDQIRPWAPLIQAQGCESRDAALRLRTTASVSRNCKATGDWPRKISTPSSPGLTRARRKAIPTSSCPRLI